MIQNSNESLAKATKSLMLDQPFWGLFSMSLNKMWSSKVPTAGVSKNGINYQLYINQKFWDSLSPKHQIGILQHEAAHIGYQHLETIWDLPDKKIANIGMDLQINQYIHRDLLPGREFSKEEFDEKFDPLAKELVAKYKAGELTKEQYQDECLKIPPRGCYIEDYIDQGFELKAGSKYYYDKLMEKKDQKNRTGTTGSKVLDNLLDQSEGDSPMIPDHSSWQEFEGLSEADKRLLKSQVEHQLKEVTEQIKKSRGTLPSEMSEYLEGLNKKDPPKFNWRGYLRRFIGGSDKTYTKKTRRKFSKRFEDNPGLKIKKLRHILCVVDTSGSVSTTELKEFFHEIYHIHKGGTEVTVLQCDAAISSITPYKKGCEDKIKISGRGGTAFAPFIAYANEHSNKFSGVVVFTDGEAPAPEKCKLRTLWVHSSQSNINESLIGYKIKLN